LREETCQGRVLREWEASADSWVRFVRDGKDYYRYYSTEPAMLDVVGDVNGRYLLDLGCGEGYWCRALARRGARVVGIDFSSRMIEEAIEAEKEERLGIEYHVADATDLRMFNDELFDMATSFMALQDIEDYDAAVAEASRVLKYNGSLLFAIPHPCFETRAIGDTRVAGWQRYWEDSAKEAVPRGEDAYFKITDYFTCHSMTVLWQRAVPIMQTTGFHRTLADYVASLSRHGLLVSRLVEPKPTEGGIRAWPSLKKHLRIPQSIVVRAEKICIL